MSLLLFYILLALGISFLCSILEAVLLSITPAYLAQLETEKPAVGERLRSLKNDIDRPLAAILSLNTIAHTIGAAGAGAEATSIFGSAYLGIFSAVLTFLILVLSEIIPKTLGATYWKQLSALVSRVLPPMIWLLWPLVKMSELLTGVLSRGAKSTRVSRDEIAALADLGSRQGAFEENESRVLRSLFHFRSVHAKDVMTPRTVLFSLPVEQTVSEILEEHLEIIFSRIPVYGEQPEDVSGYVLKNDIYTAAIQQRGDRMLKELKRPLLSVPETMPLPQVFENFIERREHIALVQDEFGGIAGLVTLEDVVETLLGLEIVDEVDSVRDMQELARQGWEKRARQSGLIPVEEESTPKNASKEDQAASAETSLAGDTEESDPTAGS